MKATFVKGITTLTEMMVFLGITSDDDQNTFTNDINHVTWGDADYTLITTYRFWTEFIKHGNLPHLLEAWSDEHKFVDALKAWGVQWVNLEE